MGERGFLGFIAGRVESAGEVSLGIMGGTFDPVHEGHLTLAHAAYAELGLDCVLFIPAGKPCFKQDRHVSSAEDRVEMLRRSLHGRDWAFLSTMEIDRGGLTYTSDTLEELSRTLPEGVRLVFLMGADSLDTLPTWNEAHKVLSLCELAVAPRDGVDLAGALCRLGEFHPSSVVHVLRGDVPVISSTQLRGFIAEGSVPDGFIDAQVLEYAEVKGLYARHEGVEGNRHG